MGLNKKNKQRDCGFFLWLDELVTNQEAIGFQRDDERQEMKMKVDEMEKKMQMLQEMITDQRKLGNCSWKLVLVLAFAMWIVMYLNMYVA